APAGVTSPTYQIMQTTAQQFCPFPSNVGDYAVVETTTARSITIAKTVPNVAHFVFVRVQQNPCIATAVTHAADTFSAPPAKPVPATITAPGGHATVSF